MSLPAWTQRSFAALVIGTAVVARACPQLPVAHSVLIPDALVLKLDSIADTASIEHYRCLLGQQVGDSLIIVRAWEPQILHADYNTVTAGGCPKFTVGTWHNHIPYTVPMNDPHNRSVKVEPWSVCEMSPADHLASKREPWTFAMISVAAEVHCAWQRLEDSSFQRMPWAMQ